MILRIINPDYPITSIDKAHSLQSQDPTPAMLDRIIRFFSIKIGRLLQPLGFDVTLASDDRRTLHEDIFPFFINNEKYKNILFVGCEWYTKSYEKLFSGKNYTTIEIDPELKKYGAKNHIIDSVENIANHIEPGSLDCIICNGVFGWGLNDIDAIEKTFNGCYESLDKDGVLVIGWNDIPKATPVKLDEVKALKRFNSFVIPSLGTQHYLTKDHQRHTYSFYVKE